MTRAHSVLAGVLLLLFACTDESPLEPRAPQPPALTKPLPGPAALPPALVTLAACTHHWASATSGSWFDAAKWTPASVPGASSSACIDAAGTYTVTLDPANDATPVNLDALTIGGGASGAQSLALGGSAATVNIATGVDVKANGVLSIPGFTAMLLSSGTVANAGSVKTTATCGGCGVATIRADLVNSGTLQVASNGLVLDKVNGSYANTGAVDVLGELTIPASAGSPSFTQQSGRIASSAVNTNGVIFQMQSGTFTYNGGDIQSTTRGMLLLDGVDLVFGPSPTGTALINILPSASGNSFTGNIGATQTVRMPLVGGSPTLASRTLTLVGDVTNAGSLEIAPSPGTNFPIIAGTGTLTNTGTLKITGTGNDSSRIAINLLNQGTMEFRGSRVHFDQPTLTYSNAGQVANTGPSDPTTIQISDGATFTNQPGAQLNINVDVIRGGHLKGAGTNAANLRLGGAGTLDPGLSPGIFTASNVSMIDSSGTINIELGGGAPGDYDQLIVAGQMTYTPGRLNVIATGAFEAGRCGQVFDIVKHQSPGGTGKFSAITGLNFSGGRRLRAVYTNPSSTGPGNLLLVGFDASAAVSLGPNPVAVAEGGPSQTYFVCLNKQPSGNVVVTRAADAQVSVTPASVTFTPSDWEQPKAFTLTAVDDQAVEGNHTGTVTHTVASTDGAFNNASVANLVANITDNDANGAPTATNDGATTPEDQPVTIDVLTNDTDPENDGLTVLGVTQPAIGSAAITGGGQTVRFTPAANFNGPASFSYTIGDGHGNSATGTVNVTVTPVNDSPTAVNDAAATTAPNPVSVPVLSNDTDPDGDALQVSTVTQPANGTAAIAGGGQSVTYTPPAGFSGQVVFNYTASDGRGGSATASISVTVSAEPPPSSADLQLQVSDSPDPVRASKPLKFNLALSNTGPAAGTHVLLTIKLPQALRTTPLSFPSGLSCHAKKGTAGTYICQIPAQPAGSGVAHYLFRISPPAPGTITTSFVVDGRETDPNVGNNLVSVTTTVR